VRGRLVAPARVPAPSYRESIAPVALERMSYEAESEWVTYCSDKAAGPTADAERVDPLEFLARRVTPIPDPGQVMQRSYGW